MRGGGSGLGCIILVVGGEEEEEEQRARVDLKGRIIENPQLGVVCISAASIDTNIICMC